MWCLLTFIIAIAVGIAAGVLSEKREWYRWEPVTTPVCVLSLAYGIIGLLAFIFTDSAETDYRKYMKAKSECELLKTEANVSMETVTYFTEYIDSMNKRIEKSKKYKDHWYLKNFYNEETAALEPLNYDTVNVKIVLK
jgi:hypothetical protein